MQATPNLAIPFDVLTATLRQLPLEQKRQVVEWLEEWIAQTEDDELDTNRKFQAELDQARTAYASGDYVTIEEYISQKP